MSAGHLSNLLIKNQSGFEREKSEIYEAGLLSSPWQHFDMRRSQSGRSKLYHEFKRSTRANASIDSIERPSEVSINSASKEAWEGVSASHSAGSIKEFPLIPLQRKRGS